MTEYTIIPFKKSIKTHANHELISKYGVKASPAAVQRAKDYVDRQRELGVKSEFIIHEIMLPQEDPNHDCAVIDC